MLFVQCISTIALVKNESEVLDSPIWIMLINVVALEMLKAKMPRISGYSLKCRLLIIPKQRQLSHSVFNFFLSIFICRFFPFLYLLIDLFFFHLSIYILIFSFYSTFIPICLSFCLFIYLTFSLSIYPSIPTK